MAEQVARTEGWQDEVMTVRDVARYLRISETKVYRMAQEGGLPCMKIGRAWRFQRELLEQWMREESGRAKGGGILREGGGEKASSVQREC